VRDIAGQLGRRGIDFWLDEEQIAPSDALVDAITRGLADMTHFSIIWSSDCVDAPWVKRELNVAISKLVENNIPIIIVRLDDAVVPDIIRDILWINGNGESPIEIGNRIADTVYRLEKRVR
jgi:hypothetical protein